MPICVAGMHRSGTSLVARLLHAAGMHLGDERDLIPAGRGNTDGHWENARFVAINDEILAAFGGSWKSLAPLPPNWHLDAKLDEFLERAAELLATFAGREPWGWKDPRNCLTLPFWRRLVPELKVVVVLRNPLDVAHSLALRDGIDMREGVQIWAAHLSRIFAATSAGDRLVTHYESYFIDPFAEAQRLFDFTGLRAEREVIVPLVKADLRHNLRPLEELLGGGIQLDFVRLYFDACAEAGPVFLRDFPQEVMQTVALTSNDGIQVGDAAMWRLGRVAEEAIRGHVEVADLTRQNTALKQAHDHACVERDDARREVSELRERLSAKRYRWADRFAGWLSCLRGK